MVTDSIVWTENQSTAGEENAGERLRDDALIALVDDGKKAEQKPQPKGGEALPQPPADAKTAPDSKPTGDGKVGTDAKPTGAKPADAKAGTDTKTQADTKPAEIKFASEQGKSVFDEPKRLNQFEPTNSQLSGGRTRQDRADGSWLEYDADSRLNKIRYADGTYREVKWNGQTPTSVRTRSGETFEHMYQNGTYYDRWVKKDGSYWDGTITVDEKTGDYVLTTAGQTDKQINKSDGSVEILHADKSTDIRFASNATAKHDSSGNLTALDSATGRQASITWGVPNGQPGATEVVPTAATITTNGITAQWQLKDGNWLKDGKPTKSRLAVDSGKLMIINPDGEDEIWHQSGAVEQRKKDGSVQVQQKNADGTVQEYVLKNTGTKNEIVSQSTTRNGNRETWELKQSGSSSSLWQKSGTDVTESRTNVALTPGGIFSYQRADGSLYRSTADGKESITHRTPDWAVYREGGKVSRAAYKDGTVRVFTWSGDTIETVTVEKPDSTTLWQRTGPDKYKAGNTEYSARLTIDQEGNYSFLQLSGVQNETIRRPNGIEVTKLPATKTEVERDGGKITRLLIDGKERVYNRDSDGKIQSIADPAHNIVWNRDKNNSWSAQAIDTSKNFAAPEKLIRKGNGEPTEDGKSVFISDDNTIIEDKLDGSTNKFTAAKDIVKSVVGNKNLSEDEQYAILNSIAAFESRTIDAKERAAAYKEIDRMLTDKSTSPFSEKERAKIAAQVLWLMANPHRNEQGQHNTCSITSIRTCMLREEPSKVAKVIADITTTGKLVAADKTEIAPHASSFKPGAEEQQEPSPPGARVWASQLWDVATTNVYWQRATKDPNGNTVPQGSMYYEQVVPQSRGDSVERLYRYDTGGQAFEVANPEGGTVTRHPYLVPSAINDVYEQITGKDQTNRVIINGTLGSSSKLAVVNTADELHTTLSKREPWPRIIQVHTSRQPFYGDSGYGSAGGAGGPTGGWHVLAVTDYDDKAKQASLDNSWSPTADHLSKDRAVPVQQLFDSTIGQYPVQTAQPQVQNVAITTISKLGKEWKKPAEQYNADATITLTKDWKSAGGGRPKAETEIQLGLELVNQGCIESMLLPGGWLPAKRTKEPYLQQKEDQFKLPGADGNLSFFYRGTRLSEHGGKAFSRVLSAKPHELSKDEVDSISQTLSNLADKRAFNLQSARTVNLNGKRVLQVEGTWKTSEKKFHGILVDAGADATVVQEIFYEADAKHFEQNIEKVKNAISTIRWK